MPRNSRIVKHSGLEAVVQDNRLVDAPRFFSLQEQKFFIFLISQLNPLNKEELNLRIPLPEFAKALGMNDDSNARRDLKHITKNLMSRVIEMRDEIEDSVTLIHLVSYAKYWLGKGYADIRISEEIAPYLFDLKERFTTYKLSNAMKLSSFYAVRIYELLKKHEKLKQRTFTIDELKQKLGIKKGQYSRTNNFKARVLDIAVREINKKTDIKINFELKKSEGKTQIVCFYIDSQTIPNSDELFSSENIEEQSKLIPDIKQIGYSTLEALDIIEEHNENQIKNAIEITKLKIAQNKVKSPKALFRAALKNKWTPTKKQEKKLNKSSYQQKQNLQEKPKNRLSKILNYLLFKN